MLLTGKAFITMAYNIAYLYGSEIFPTEVRNVGIGVAAVMEDVGGFVAPLIAGPLVGLLTLIIIITRMWANAQRDGRPAECRWRPLFNAAKFG